ncbi:methyltransferase domain-containing protein, partial [Pseudomonas aeruginosa]
MPDDSAPLLAPHGVAALPDKRRVAASFSRAAASYDAVAELQRGVGESLLSALPEGFSPRRWVDLGCGTGHFSRALERRFGAAEGLAVDIAEGMLRHARARGGASHFIGGDAERLPLRDGSCDL